MSERLGPGRAPWLRRVGGLDFHVLHTLLFRGWGIAAGGATIFLLPLWLDPVEQGYYYTFASLLALQVFFELGLNGIIVQLASHEAARIEFHAGGTIAGDSEAIGRLGALVRLMRRWYAAGALLFALAAGAAGWIFFHRQGVLPASQWGPVWAVLVLATSLNLYLSPQLAAIEGIGRVGQVARLRLVQAMVGYGTLWTMLASGAGLWSAVAVPAAAVVLSFAWLRHAGQPLRAAQQHGGPAGPALRWRNDVFPLQWRTAVSWACGYLSFNLFTPVVFAHLGAAEAGRLGLALSVFSAVTSLGLSWIAAKLPAFTTHIARREYQALDALFIGVTARSTVFSAGVAFAVVAAAALAVDAGVAAMDRIAAPWTLFWLACATVSNVLTYACACYMRAHREEPLVAMSVVAALAIAAAVFASSDAGVATMMALNAGVSALVSLPWALALLRGYRARHARESAAPAPTLGP